MTINYDFSAWELALTGRVVCWSKSLTVVSDSQEESSPLSRKRKEDRQTNESRATKRKNFLFCSPTVPGPAKIVRIGRPRDSDRLQAGARVAGRPGPFEPDVPDGEEVPPVAEDALRRGDPGWEAGIDRRGRRAELSAHVQEESPGPLGQDRQSTRPILLHARGSVPAQGRLAPRGSSRGGNESPSFLCTRKRGEQQSLLRSFFRSFLSSFSRAIETIDFFFFSRATNVGEVSIKRNSSNAYSLHRGRRTHCENGEIAAWEAFQIADSARIPACNVGILQSLYIKLFKSSPSRTLITRMDSNTNVFDACIIFFFPLFLPKKY